MGGETRRKRMRKLRDGIPVISLDYARFKGKKGYENESMMGNPLLVMQCRDAKLIWIRVLLGKGVGPYSVKVVSDMVLFAGHRRVILKIDGEIPMTAHKEAVKGPP